ncbi:hypothetical protein TNCV_2294961 [Trichonephila clavipes]|nr:hypothetical protein TNCV_2294961 [Trichonephila clavipes]
MVANSASTTHVKVCQFSEYNTCKGLPTSQIILTVGIVAIVRISNLSPSVVIATRLGYLIIPTAVAEVATLLATAPIVRRDRKEGWEKFCGFKLVWAFACRLQLPSSTPVEVPEIIIHYNLSLHHSKQSLLMKGAFSRLWGFGGRENGDVQTIFTASFLYQIKEGSLAESNVRFRADYYGVIGRNGCRFSLPSSSIPF